MYCYNDCYVAVSELVVMNVLDACVKMLAVVVLQ